MEASLLFFLAFSVEGFLDQIIWLLMINGII